MSNDLTTSIASLSSEQLDKLFEGIPDDAINSNTVQSAVVVEEEEKTPQLTNNPGFNGVPVIDLDKLEDDAPEEEEKKTPKEKEKTKPAEESVEEPKPKEEEDNEASDEELAQINSVLKRTTDYLVEKGLFKDFEGRETVEMDTEKYAELVEKQVQAMVEERYQERKAATGEYGQAIIDYIEQGGNADDVIDLFKEQQAIEQFEIGETDSQKDIITKWYKDQHGWSETKINKFLTTLQSESDEALEQEAQEIKDKYKEHFDRQLQTLKQQQAAYEEEQKNIKRQFETNITKAIDAQAFDDKRKKFLKDSVFKLKRTQDGRQISDLYLKFAELQSNPESYAEFVEWVMDKEGYLKRQQTAVQNELVDKTFNFVKGNTALSKDKGSRHSQTDKNNKSTGVDFSFVLKR